MYIYIYICIYIYIYIYIYTTLRSRDDFSPLWKSILIWGNIIYCSRVMMQHHITMQIQSTLF